MIEAIKELIDHIGPVYLNFSPPTSGITLYATAGFAPDLKHNYNNPGLQVRVAYDTDTHAQVVMNAIYARLIGFHDGNVFTDIQPTQEPFFLMRDSNNRVVYAQNYDIQMYSTPNREN